VIPIRRAPRGFCGEINEVRYTYPDQIARKYIAHLAQIIAWRWRLFAADLTQLSLTFRVQVCCYESEA
jgi:hypothetical protein